MRSAGGTKISITRWLLVLTGITAIVFSPMLSNGFTNWDDESYVINNALLRGPDWTGIFTQPVVSNYHPLTIISLAINYGLSRLDPSSYFLLNFLLHLINTILVFYLAGLLSGQNTRVAFLTALLFGIHPMHVESVAWISARKDLLYTLFFLAGLIQYWRYLAGTNKYKLWICFLLFGLSLLSKPAAIIFPVVLLLLDYWKGRHINREAIIEKIPFFILSVIFGWITIRFQSGTAIAGLEQFPVWTRPFFASYALMMYFFRFIIPYPLSAFHPYPSADELGWPVWLSPVFIIALLAVLWRYRSHKLIIFSVVFYIVNLLLVSQIIAIGNTLLAERYTYVPYIGLAFLFSTVIFTPPSRLNKAVTQIIPAVLVVAFGVMAFQRTKVWRDSASLWTDAIKHYPNAPLPRTNRANHAIKLSLDPAYKDQANVLLQQALDDCSLALKNNPYHANGYQNRQQIYLRMNRDSLALADANSLLKLDPKNKFGYNTRGMVYLRFRQPEKALEDFNKSLSIDPNADFVINARGQIQLNYFRQYREALADFDKAIQLNPLGEYYLNRSFCSYALGDTLQARTDAQSAMKKGKTIPEEYRKLINL